MLCCRVDSPMAEKEEDAAGMFGHVGYCDIPAITVDSLFDFLFSLNFPIKFFVYLGDTPAHDTYYQYPLKQMRGITYVSELLSSKRNKTGDVYPVLGNHDTYPCDHFDPYTDKHQWMLNNITSLWKPWLNKNSLKTLNTKGVYSQLHPGTKLKVIGLNPFVMLSTNPYLWNGKSDPLGILTWLEKELAESEVKKESVLILSHESPEVGIMNPRNTFSYK